MNKKSKRNICSVKQKMFLALVTVICLIQSFQQQTIKEKQPVYNNKVKMWFRRFILFFWRPLNITGESAGLSPQVSPFYAAASRHRYELDFLTPPHKRAWCQSFTTTISKVHLSPGNQPQPLSLCVSQTFQHNGWEIALHREQEIILTSSLSVGTLCKKHAWAQLKCSMFSTM